MISVWISLSLHLSALVTSSLFSSLSVMSSFTGSSHHHHWLNITLITLKERHLVEDTVSDTESSYRCHVLYIRTNDTIALFKSSTGVRQYDLHVWPWPKVLAMTAILWFTKFAVSGFVDYLSCLYGTLEKNDKHFISFQCFTWQINKKNQYMQCQYLQCFTFIFITFAIRSGMLYISFWANPDWWHSFLPYLLVHLPFEDWPQVLYGLRFRELPGHKFKI